MAASVGLKLFHPYRVWLVFNALTVVLIVIASLGIIRISQLENQKLIERQLETLVKARISDLEHRRYRFFVEGIGREFTNLFASIEGHGFLFQTGSLPVSSVCAQTSFKGGGFSAGDVITIKMCRPYHSPVIPLAVLIGAFIILSAFSLKFVTSLEHSTFCALVEFIENSGVKVDISQGLVGLLEKIKSIQIKLDEAKQKEVEMAKAETLAKTATQVAHDIRSPLSSLQAGVEYLREMTIHDPKAPEALNLLELSAQRLTGIADDLLKKHKGEGETCTVFSLHQVLDELVGEFQGRSEYKGIAFVKRYFSSAIHLDGSQTQLQRAFGNIIKNAIEAMKGEGTITLFTDKPNGQAVVNITDTGPGMAPETMARILRGGYTQGKEEGHGIGMKVVQETVEEFGGNLTAQSEMGRGTTFTIELPLRAAREETYTLAIPSDRIPVLVVDDEPSIREQWRLVLKERGLAALLCTSYEDVTAQKINSALVQTAVVDYHFDNSEKNGADIVKYLQSQGLSNITLCTAEYWKPSVQSLARDLNVKLCPKPLPRIVIAEEVSLRAPQSGTKQSPVKPVEIASSPPSASPRNDKEGGYKVLVIDDDAGIRMTWEMVRDRLNIKTLHAFANLESLLADGVDLKAVEMAFVDKNIEGSKYSGAQTIDYLKDQGVPKVILASGEEEAQLKKDPQFARADFISREKVPQNVEVFL